MVKKSAWTRASRRAWRRACALGFLLLAAGRAGAQADYFAPEAVTAFAAHLFAQGDYLRAGYEYERYLLGLNRDSRASAHELAGRAFRCGGDLPRALEHFRRMRETAVDPAQREQAAAEIGLCHLHLGEAEASLREVRGETGWEASASLRRIAAGDLILLERWEEARQAAPDVELAALARRGEGLRRKSPALAVGLSALIPGSGKMYAGETGDGLQSLLLIGALAALAGTSFHADGVALLARLAVRLLRRADVRGQPLRLGGLRPALESEAGRGPGRGPAGSVSGLCAGLAGAGGPAGPAGDGTDAR